LNKILIPKEDLINHLELNSLLKRYPQNLSGGEKLRVALARTILKQSDYLLLDEPMSDLDIKTKARILNFLKMINKKFKIPILYVSHSIEEISQIADEIILLNNGKKVSSGSLSKTLNSNSFQKLIGKFESSSVLEGILSETDQLMKITTLDVNGQKLIVPGRPGLIGNIVRVRIRSRDVIVSPVRVNTHITENQLEGIITNIYTEKDTAFSELVINLKNSKINKKSQLLRARITTYNLNKMKIAENKKVFIYISSVSIDRQAYQY
jgi:molybdate transport system ATP-binding protein